MSNDNNDNRNKVRRRKISSSPDRSNSNTSKSDNSTSSRHPKKTIQNKKNDKFKPFRIAGIVVLVLLVLGTAIGTALVFSSLRNVEAVNKAMLDQKTHETTKINYATGDILSNAPSENKKEPVKLEQMGDYLPDAIVAIEDQRFYEHSGVDIKGLLRSAVKTLTGNTQGGSTIPMQVSKMLLTSTDQTIMRKVKDIYYAYEMSKTLSKEEILELYLNNFFVGKGLAGAEAGARGYFDKKAEKLTLAESAMIAGATKYPAKYSAYMTAKLEGNETKEYLENRLLFFINTPDDNWDDPNEFDLEMVDKLQSWGLITDSDLYNQLKAGTMIVRKAANNPDAKKRQETVLYKMLELGFITQQEHDDAVAEEIQIKLPKKKDTVASSVEDYIEYEVIDALMEQGNTSDEAYNLFYNGGLIINTTIDPNMQATLEKEYENGNNFPGNVKAPNGVLQPQSGMVILDYKTGQIKAMVGGRGITARKAINRAVEPQQPGSTIKPLSIYTPAIDTLKITQSTPFSDARGGYKFNHGSWNPATTTSGKGTMSFRKSLAYSSNTIAIKAAEMLGSTKEETIDVMMNYLHDFGITTVIDSKTADEGNNDRNYAALTLGGLTSGISPLEMASAYGALANGGIYVEPSVFTTITTYDGQLIVKTTPDEHKVVDPEVAYVLTDMLSAVITEGIGGKASIGGSIPVAGKTGTTNGGLEAWFVGYTPYYVGATYIADDAGIGQGFERRSVQGGSGSAAKLWSTIMKQIHTNLAPTKFKVPDGVYFTKINPADGGKSSVGSSAAFINGTAPSKYTSVVQPKPQKPYEKPEEEKPPTEGGGTTPPPTEGGGTTPPPTDDGGTTPPPTEGGGTTPPPTEGGGTTPPPTDGGGTTPAPQ